MLVLQPEQKTVDPLDGVVVCVSKKLSKKQSELNAVAASLGADFRYQTYFIVLCVYVVTLFFYKIQTVE